MTRLSLRELQTTKPVPVTPVEGSRKTAGDEADKKAWRSVPDAAWPKPVTASAEISAPGRKEKLTPGSLPVDITPITPVKKQGGAGNAVSGEVVVEVLDRKSTERAGVSGVLLSVESDGGDAELGINYASFRNALGADWASRLTLTRVPQCALTDPGADDCAPAPVETAHNDADKQTLSARVDLGEGAADVAPNSQTKRKPAQDKPGTPGKPGTPAEAGSAEPGSAKAEPTKAGTTKSRPANAKTADAKTAATQPATDESTAKPARRARSLFAVQAAPSGAGGGGGDFRATPLSPSGSWEAGDSSGGFSWTYDLNTPNVPGEMGPELSLGYSSSSVDGRTAATNNQANNVGDGWSLEPGFIERRYTSCNADMKDGNNKVKNGDLCWGGHNAVLSLGGSTTELVRDDATGTWKPQQDDGSKVELVKDAGRGNGDNDGEYWKVTDTAGIQYFFGYHKLPGWTSGKTTTNSTWTVPVHGNHAGEPCHKDTFADSWCQQAWRWNLDYVLTPHGDAMAYYWGKEQNRYGRNVSLSSGSSTATPYTRGGYLKKIEYGLRHDDLYTGTPAAKVTFTTAERCLATSSFDCAATKFTAANAKHWPDVPYDQHCKSGDECKNRYSPSFWSRKRITDITTEVRAGTGYQKVDSWKLTHSFPSTGDGSSPALWLKSVQHTGHTGGTSETTPAVTFRGTQLANRVDRTGDGIPPLIRYRVHAIDTESGGTIGITYSAPQCTASKLPAEETNTKRCYPVYWTSPDSPGADYKPTKDWFHTYVVTQVREEDHVGGAPAKQTDYTYLGGAAWAKTQDEFTEAKYRTHADFRGYGHVRTETGTGGDGTKLRTETRYFRGIPGAQVKDSEGVEAGDHPVFAGMTREEATFEGGKLIEASASTPWKSAATATRKRGDGLPALQSFVAGDSRTQTSRTAVGDTWRRTKVERTYDSYGMPATESDHGDTAKFGDETCTTTTYARNTKTNLVELAASVKTVAKACGTTPDLPNDLISEKRTYFDNATTLGAAPTKGDVTRADEQNAAGTGFITVERNKTDRHGRTIESTDATGAKTTTQYTPATDYAPTRTVVTNALGHTETTESEPGRGLPTAKVDANGKRTDSTYDGMGRATKVWEQGWTKAAHPDTPSKQFTYTVTKTEPTVVTTKTLRHNGDYRTEYAFFDGLLRERESQAPSANGVGRIIGEKKYDSRGLEWKTYDAYYATGDASGTLVTGDDTKTPDATRTVYDGAGRTTAQIREKYGDEQTRVTTRHDGDRTTVIPPRGDTATTTVTDVHDRTTELIQYTDAERTTSQSTTYTYTPTGKHKTVTDPSGATWTYTYDHRDRAVKTDDPDKGTTHVTYDDADRPVTTTDARGTELTTGYDALGRKTKLTKGNTLLSSWTWDTVAKGLLTKATRHAGGQEYVAETTGFDDRYQPTATKVTIPAREGALAATYQWTYGYNARTGLVDWTRQPALPGQAAERVTNRYGSSLPYDQLVMTGPTAPVLVNNITYDPFGRPLRTEYGPKGRHVWDTKEYDEHTGNLIRTTTDRETGPSRIDDVRYGFDAASNINKLVTASGQDEERSVDTQCFTTDALRRITNAWTATDSCAAKPDAAGGEGGTAPKVGGPDAYWHTFTYDAIGNRRTETQHKIDGDPLAAHDVKRTYSYGEKGAGKRQLTSVSNETDGERHEDTYSYDAAGNTTSRAAGGREQEMSWDAEGHLAKAVEAGRTTGYLYSADGDRILSKTPNATTLYLPGGNEVTLNKDGTKSSARYYTAGDETVAVKTGGQVSILLSDHLGTATTAVVLGAGQAITRRKTHIFGGQRTAQSVNWPGNRGFVGGTTDTTGLTHLGAREYDPTLGRFISVDPVMDTADPQQMHGYTYGNNNPVIHADPDGKFFGSFVKKLKKTINKMAKTAIRAVKRYTKWYGRLKPYQKQQVRIANASRGISNKFYDGIDRARTKAKADAAARETQKRQDAERRRKDSLWGNIKKGEFGEAWNKTGGKAVTHVKEHWRGYAQGGAFVVCVVGTAGYCTVAGAALLAADNIADGVNGEFSKRKFVTQTLWLGAGAGAGRMLAGSWRGSAFTRGPSGPRAPLWRGSTRPPAPKGGIDWGQTGRNMSTNAGMSWAGCGAGGFSGGQAACG
ncbi:RHS repeat-associated core domain-containing protein [Streptomyces sp. NPDC018029]|uniref:RHS repeat-associated core domain-containing protein n=1 Tax=Streptomyces sp. NPDC018029 TaxID=3365032 RepID=UPI00379DA197